MLLEFIVANYRSIGDEQTLSLVPAPKQRDFTGNILHQDGYEALDAVALYGANGSGKSNLLGALILFAEIIGISGRFASTQALPWEPFLLREGWTQKPTKFEVTFTLQGNRYRYGIEFTTTVQQEWLYRKGKGREVPLFLRQDDTIDIISLKANSKLIEAAIEATRPNGLFLSVCDTFNIDEAKTIFGWFDQLQIVNERNKSEQAVRTLSMWDDIEYQTRIIDYMTRMNTGLSGISILEEDFDESAVPRHFHESLRQALVDRYKGQKQHVPMAHHYIYNHEGKQTTDQVTWRFEDQESAGTNRALQLSGPILWALLKGGLIVVDEIEAFMHPIMTLDTIDLFLNKEVNKYGAQIIFATHDTNLLSYAKLRRDQIYFAEKNKWESTEIYSLADFVYISDTPGVKSKERPDTDKEKRYIEGRYGAIPMLGKLNING